ncbi:hypothetical protein WN944_002076 [Citrus x changshan-huyou]|uniref:Leucine-rich repeat-containing N-terminal plant-type domain-containing protein n=1 Tax=Citrus x changshan-huyou TaxID=2935761 RepID=A0AAP0MHN4_9ROSI
MERIPSPRMMIRFLLLHCLILSFMIASANTTSITTDQQALLALKGHVTDDPANFLAKNWDTSSFVCNWTGITCDIRTQRVTALNISGLNLTGTIPSELGDLSSLQTLDLSFNWFSGEIPEALGNLAELEELWLKNNFLTGTIPSSIFNLSSLSNLDLSYNNLKGIIPSQLGNPSSLQKLFLNYNQLSGLIPSFILCKSSSLDNIRFEYKILFGELPGELPANICNNLPFLEILLLDENNFGSKIPSTLSRRKHLQTLLLSINDFSRAIPKEIGNLTRLKSLYLSQNRLQDFCVASKENKTVSFAIEFGKFMLSGREESVPLDQIGGFSMVDSQSPRKSILYIFVM